jgi:hypothetical protein
MIHFTGLILDRQRPTSNFLAVGRRQKERGAREELVRTRRGRYGEAVNARAIAVLAVVGLGGLLWWQTRPTSSASRHTPATTGTASTGVVAPPALEPEPVERDPDREWRPTSYDAVDWQPGEEPMGWDRWLAGFVRPQPGEGIFEYRDRLVPVAQMAIAPHRQAVDGLLDRSIAGAGLSAGDRAEVDAIIGDAQRQLKERIQNGVFGGELFGPGAKPIGGVRFARDLLEVVIAADDALRAALSPAERRAFDEVGFDLAFYLLVATRWEELIGVPSTAARPVDR